MGVDDAEQGVQVGQPVDGILREISEEVVLVGNVDSGNAGIGRLGAIEVEPRCARDDQTGEPLENPSVGPVQRAQQQKSRIRRGLPGLHELDFLIDRDHRALRITLDEVRLVRCLLTHRGLKVGQPVRNRGTGERFGRGDQHRGVVAAGGGVDVVGDDAVLPELAGRRHPRATHHQRGQRVVRVVRARDRNREYRHQCQQHHRSAGEQRNGQRAARPAD